jgi:phosphate starvation-inducible protein PhoH
MAAVSKRKKARSKKDDNVVFLNDALSRNGRAVDEFNRGEVVKNFTLHDLKSVKPLTYNQNEMFQAYFSGSNIVASGSAGAGKSFSACYLALTDVLDKNSRQEKIIIVRGAVQTREIGFTPGDIKEKMEPYEAPYKDIFAGLLGKKSAYEIMKDRGMIEFHPTSFVRGLTWDNAVIILDESQSCNFHEIASVLTRCGDDSKVIVIGDTAQNDLIYKKNDQSGLPRLLEVAKKMKEFEVIHFTRDDIVRSKFVKSFIVACEDTP